MGWTAHQWQAWSFPALTLLAMLGGVILWDGGVAHLSACPAQQMAFLAVNGGSTILPAWFWYGLTGLGDAAVLMPALALLTLRKPQAWAAVVASVPTAALMSVLGKHWSAVARPAAVLDASSFTLIGEALRYNSFPSGHSITVFAAAAAVLATLLPSPRTSRARLLLAARCRCDGCADDRALARRGGRALAGRCIGWWRRRLARRTERCRSGPPDRLVALAPGRKGAPGSRRVPLCVGFAAAASGASGERQRSHPGTVRVVRPCCRVRAVDPPPQPGGGRNLPRNISSTAV